MAQIGSGTSDEDVITWMCLAILCTIALFVVAFLPRVVVAFWHRSAFDSCFVLSGRQAFEDARLTRPAHATITPYLPKAESEVWSENLMTADRSPSSECSNGSSIWLDEEDRLSKGSSALPMHIPSYSTLLHPFSMPFTWHLTSEYSGGKILAVLVLIASYFIVSFVADGDPIGSPDRQGWIATALIPFTIAFGTKNNLVCFLLSKSSEKVRTSSFKRWNYALTNLPS